MVALIQASLAFSLAFVLVAALSPWLSRTVGVRWWYWVWLLLALRLLIPYSAAWPQAPLVLEASEAQTQVELTPVEAQTPAAAQSPAEAPTAATFVICVASTFVATFLSFFVAIKIPLLIPKL